VAILRSAAYADEFASFLGSRSLATVEQATFDKAKHAMAIVDQPAEYKRAHVDQLLSQVACWRLQSGGHLAACVDVQRKKLGHARNYYYVSGVEGRVLEAKRGSGP